MLTVNVPFTSKLHPARIPIVYGMLLYEFSRFPGQDEFNCTMQILRFYTNSRFKYFSPVYNNLSSSAACFAFRTSDTNNLIFSRISHFSSVVMALSISQSPQLIRAGFYESTRKESFQMEPFSPSFVPFAYFLLRRSSRAPSFPIWPQSFGGCRYRPSFPVAFSQRERDIDCTFPQFVLLVGCHVLSGSYLIRIRLVSTSLFSSSSPLAMTRE